MDKASYLSTQQAITVIAMMAKDLDLDAFLAQIEQAETLGPVLDPTLYREAMGQLADLKRCAEALRPFVEEVRRQMDEADAKTKGEAH